jgi:transcriptional regulator with XRE-family HTH domain
MIVKDIRCSKRLSLRAVALRAGMSYTYLCNVENGKADPSLSTLKRLAGALKVSVCDLVKDERPIGQRVVKRKG